MYSKSRGVVVKGTFFEYYVDIFGIGDLWPFLVASRLFLARSFTLLISFSHVLIYIKDQVGKRKPPTICSKNTNRRQNIMTKSDVLCKDLLLDLV